MKNLCICLFILSCAHLFAQNDSTANRYPFKIVRDQEIPMLSPGNYVFKDQLDFINLRPQKNDNIFLEPAFFSVDQIGIIIVSNLANNQYLTVAYVTETADNVIIHTALYSSYARVGMPDYGLFVTIPKTSKEILFSQIEIELDDYEETKNRISPY